MPPSPSLTSWRGRASGSPLQIDDRRQIRGHPRGQTPQAGKHWHRRVHGWHRPSGTPAGMRVRPLGRSRPGRHHRGRGEREQVVRLHHAAGRPSSQHQASLTLRGVVRGFQADPHGELVEHHAAEPETAVADLSQLDDGIEQRIGDPGDVGGRGAQRAGIGESVDDEGQLVPVVPVARHAHAERSRNPAQLDSSRGTGEFRGGKQLDTVQGWKPPADVPTTRHAGVEPTVRPGTARLG